MHKIYLFFIFLMLSAGLMAQTTIIAVQNFETTPATPTLPLTASITNGTGGSAGTITGQTASGDRPNGANYFTDVTTGYRVLNSNTTLTSDAVNTTNFSDVHLTFRLASISISSTSNGADGNDLVTVSISPDNGTTYYSRLIVAGNSNAYWSFTTGTGTASGNYATNNTATNVAPSGGGSRNIDGYSTVDISGLPNASQLKIRINILNNSTGEAWVIDEVKISGAPATGPTITLNTTNFNGAFGNVNVGASSTSSSFSVSGTNLTNDITVTPPAGGFEIRTGTNAFSTTAIVLPQSSGSVAATTIDARFTPTATGAQSGNITASSTGATDKTAAVSGTGVQPNKLAITAITPASPTINTAFSVTVQSQDANGTATNVLAATSFYLSVNTGNGMLGGTVTGTIAAGSNQATLTGVTYNTAESGVVLTATRTAGDVLAAGNSAAFNVAGVASQLAFVNFPASGSANSNVASFTVEARRADGSVDANYTGSITLSKASGAGNVTGTLTKAAVAGVATFSDIKFSATDTYMLTAASSSLASATSSAITIAAAAVAINPGELLINQMSPDYNTADDEYVELVNTTNKTLDLSTIALKYQASTGGNSTVGGTLSGSIAPYSYWLLSPNATITIGQTVALSRDGSYSPGFAAPNGQIALVRLSDNTIIDAVGYGAITGGIYTETSMSTSAPAPPTNGGIRRITEGVDNNVNRTDFTTVAGNAIDLRNSTSRISNSGATITAGTYNRLYVTGNSSLGGAVNVTGRLVLSNNTILTTTTVNVLKLGSAATITNASANSFIDGPLTVGTAGTAAKLLPIGKAGIYKPVTITPTTATASEYTAEYFATTTPDAPLESRLNAIQTNEYWLVDRTAGTSPAKVTLDYNSTGATWSNGMNPSVSDVISIIHLRSSNNTWTQEYGTTVPNNTNTASLTTGTISDFSPFTFGYGPTSVLPVVITSFTGTKTLNVNVLSWKVATETNFKEYVLERSSTSNGTFKIVTTVAATQAGSYNTTDAQPAGYNYYRLKLIDRDGKISFSKIVLVINETKGFGITNVYPTVTTGAVLIDSYAATPVKATIRVVNQAGQSVYTQTVMLAQAGITNVNLSLLAKGNYLMQVLADGYSKTVKLVKQ